MDRIPLGGAAFCPKQCSYSVKECETKQDEKTRTAPSASSVRLRVKSLFGRGALFTMVFSAMTCVTALSFFQRFFAGVAGPAGGGDGVLDLPRLLRIDSALAW